MRTVVRLIIALCLLTPQMAQGADRFNAINSQLAPYGDFLSTLSSRPHMAGDYTLGTSISYDYNKLNATNIDIIEHLVIEHLFATVGISPRFDLTIDLPVSWYNRFTPPNIGSRTSNRTSLGDVHILLRAKLYRSANKRLGIALAPFITAPSGNDSEFLGDQSITGGAHVVLDGSMGHRFFWGVNLGVRFREAFNAFGLRFDEQFLTRFALTTQINKNISWVKEFTSQTTFNDFYQNEDSSPMAIHTGIKWRVGKQKHITILAMGHYGILHGTGTSQWGATMGFHFTRLKPLKTKRVSFASNEYKVSATDYKVFQDLRHALENPKRLSAITIKSYTDTDGTKNYNQRLSERRAHEMKNLLLDVSGYQGYIDLHTYGEEKINGHSQTRTGLIVFEP